MLMFSFYVRTLLYILRLPYRKGGLGKKIPQYIRISFYYTCTQFTQNKNKTLYGIVFSMDACVFRISAFYDGKFSMLMRRRCFVRHPKQLQSIACLLISSAAQHNIVHKMRCYSLLCKRKAKNTICHRNET